MSLSAKERISLRRYLKTLRCKKCKGVGCKDCGGTGDSARARKLIQAASFGIKRAPA